MSYLGILLVVLSPWILIRTAKERDEEEVRARQCLALAEAAGGVRRGLRERPRSAVQPLPSASQP